MYSKNQTQQKRHGREIIELIGEGTYDYNGRVNSFRNTLKSWENFLNKNVVPLFSETSALKLAADNTAFRFGRMFDKTSQEFNPDDLMTLGKTMIQPKKLNKPDISKNPAGYTFLGQFISHDLSFDELGSDFPIKLSELEGLKSKRNPTLELDSLYGCFFDEVKNEISNPELYLEDKCRFKLDRTLEESTHPDATFGFLNDLPRKDQTALIGDKRNDENLAIAQTHVAFLRFHNAVVDYLEQKQLVTKDKLFETARVIVIKYYQAVILYDFLPKIVDNDILDQVIIWAKTNDPKLNWLEDGKDTFIPIEFSAAAFRFGHSQLQDAYEWNSIFQSPNVNGTFENLFLFTGMGRLGGFTDPQKRFENLIGSWVIDWRRFFDFSKYDIQDVPINFSRKIDPNIADTLRQLQEFILMDPSIPISQHNLATRNLMRGRSLSLPAGQEVRDQLTAKGKLSGKPVLEANEIASDSHKEHKEILETSLKGKTPLWYYILREAEVIGEGSRLGTIGSYIVAETIVKLIQRSGISIFDNKWNPQFSLIPGKNPADGFEMVDLIKFADSETQPLINPLG